MAKDSWDAVWERVRSGKHVAVIGPGVLPPTPSELTVLHVNCEIGATSRGALDAAYRKVEQLLGEELLPPESVREPLAMGLRHRFLGDMPGQALDALLVEACNRLANWTERRVVLAFESIDAADEATVATLAQILKRPGWLRLPLLLTVRGTPQSLVAELIYLLCHEDGAAAVIEIDGEAAPGEDTVPFDWTALSPDVLCVLRAGSVLGTTFEAELVARLLDAPLGAVLEKLQWAADAGVPLVDRGEGWFSLPPETIAALQSRMLPSLLTFWHTRLGEILRHGRPAAGATGPAQPGADMPHDEPRTVSQERVAAQAEAPFDLPQGDTETATPASQLRDRYAELFEPVQHAVSSEAMPPRPTAQAEATQAPSAQRQTARRTVLPSTRPGDQTQAATHLQAAGRTEAAVAQYLAAVREAAAGGDVYRAYGLTEQALKLLNELPTSNRRALLCTQLWLERGCLQWHDALRGAPFTLQDALASLETAESSLPRDAPPEVIEQLAAVTAGICYDLGNLEALQRALVVLTETSRRLLNVGESLLATRLLNDQAAVYVRLGDPVRATHLLTTSRELFEGRLRQNLDDVMALEELAETDHLLARLLLHVQMRPGREAEAYAIGLKHARAAELAYQHLGQHQKLTRVWETLGRLALQQGQLQTAQEHLSTALDLQRQIGDVTGLARSTAALADLYIRAGQLDDAVALLANSITLNFDKGSPIGLAFNRRALGALAKATAQAHGPEAERCQGALKEVEGRLAQAESVLGQLVLPGEAS